MVGIPVEGAVAGCLRLGSIVDALLVKFEMELYNISHTLKINK